MTIRMDGSATTWTRPVSRLDDDDCRALAGGDAHRDAPAVGDQQGALNCVSLRRARAGGPPAWRQYDARVKALAY
jgi:hypothetical protein